MRGLDDKHSKSISHLEKCVEAIQDELRLVNEEVRNKVKNRDNGYIDHMFEKVEEDQDKLHSKIKAVDDKMVKSLKTIQESV